MAGEEADRRPWMELKWLQEHKRAAKCVKYHRLPQQLPVSDVDSYLFGTLRTQKPRRSCRVSRGRPAELACRTGGLTDKESRPARRARRRGDLGRMTDQTRGRGPSKRVERRTTGHTRRRAEEDDRGARRRGEHEDEAHFDIGVQLSNI